MVANPPGWPLAELLVIALSNRFTTELEEAATLRDGIEKKQVGTAVAQYAPLNCGALGGPFFHVPLKLSVDISVEYRGARIKLSMGVYSQVPTASWPHVGLSPPPLAPLP